MHLAPSIAGRFAEAAAHFPDRIAVRAPGCEWTYAELSARSSAAAIRILECAGQDPAPVAVLMDHGAPLIAVILGVVKAGKMYMAPDPSEPHVRLAAMLADSGAGLLITDRANAAIAHSQANNRLRIVVLEPLQLSGSSPAALPEISPETGAWLMYTSGSTGKPKGVWQDQEGVCAGSDVYHDLIQLTPDDRVSLITSCSLASSATPFFVALLNGASLCPFPVRSQGVERLAAWMREQKITVFHSVPTLFRHLARASGNRAFETARLIRLGGEPVLRDHVELFRRHAPENCCLMQSLSSTETGLIATLTIDRQAPLPERRLPAGRPAPGVEISLVNAEGHPVPDGAEGQIAVRSAHLRKGYWRQPELTAQKFGVDPGQARRRTFTTNDLARWLPNGLLEHLGRADRVVKIRGLRADLDEVEATLRATNLFEDAAVAATNVADGDQRIVAYVVSRTGPPAAREIRARLHGLPEHLIPSDFIPLNRLPQTPGGKVDRQALLRFSADKKPASRQGGGPRDGFERKLAHIWQSVLGLPFVGRADDFFDLGGTSLHSAQILARIEQAFNVALPMSTLLEHGTVAQLGELLARRTIVRGPGSLVLIRSGGNGKPLFLVHNGKGDLSAYGQVARRIEGRPIYGFQSDGLSGECWPATSVRRMAERYIREMTTVHPGPYFLAGSCMGGLVAFEMARQLATAGKPVGFVGLIDSAAPPYTGRRAHWHEQFLDPMRDGLRMARWAILRGAGLGRSARWLPAYRKFISSMNSLARRNYRPEFFPGTITLLLTSDAAHFKEDRRQLIRHHAADTQLIFISGNRNHLFAPPMVDELASRLGECLRQFESQNSFAANAPAGHPSSRTNVVADHTRAAAAGITAEVSRPG